jgi:hypothetical protein
MTHPEVDRVRARRDRLEHPRASNIGCISIGTKVRYCTNKPTCGKSTPVEDIPANSNKCPKCGGILGAETVGKLNYFRFRDFAPDIQKLLLAKYGRQPLAVPFTFPTSPSDCITIGRECYQGSFLHCFNHWGVQDGKWVDPHRASRKIGKTMKRVDIKCEPDSCPFAIGGIDPDTKATIKPRQCGEVISAMVWLYEMPGLGLVRFKSGGINTINNFQEGVRMFLHLLQGKWLPLKLELRLRSKRSKYQGSDGNFRDTVIQEVYIHFPEAMAELIDRADKGKLKPGDLYVMLPGTSTTPMLPAKASEPVFDELVDGPRSGVLEQRPESLPITDLKGLDEPPPPQATEGLTTETQNRINGLIKEIAGTNKYDRTKLAKRLRQTFAVESWTVASEEVGLKMVRFLQARKAQWLEQIAGGSDIDGLKSMDLNENGEWA